MPVVSGGALFDAYRRIPSPLLWRCLILLEWSSYQVGAGTLEYGCLSLSRNARVLPRYIDLEHLLILTMGFHCPGKAAVIGNIVEEG